MPGEISQNNQKEAPQTLKIHQDRWNEWDEWDELPSLKSKVKIHTILEKASAQNCEICAGSDPKCWHLVQ